MVYYVKSFAQMSPESREAQLEQLEKALHDSVQLVNEGKFDFQPLSQAEMQIERDAYPD